ncbi:MAG: PglZ domain-containing protein [Candidatus Vogelbacteria bacterium]|nr:PglZ domain-containing protein [Candidatus Vogelbacteria bacterium]
MSYHRHSNRRFQEMVFAQYKTWISEDGEVRLTSQFLRRCLKPNWDPQTEKAAVFIFDGMRYDIWDEFLKPMLGDRMELLADLPASSLLPSETHITRKAICAGATADAFDSRKGEDALLKDGLEREFAYSGNVEVITPDAMGVGETVRYRAGNLDVYIFELCDKELHKIDMKSLPDGRLMPSRPLDFVYRQHLKNIIDTEVMAIIRKLAPGTKVFITADHGFGRVHRNQIWLKEDWLNEPRDCAYLNARLLETLATVNAPAKVRDNVWEFPVKDIQMPEIETVTDQATKERWEKHYASIIFPKTGYALSRPGSNFRPDAYTHGGISIQELMIPMAVLRVKSQEEGLLMLDTISCPDEVLEGQEIEFRMSVRRASTSSLAFDDMRIDVEAAVSPGDLTLPHQVLYVDANSADVMYTYRPDTTDATTEERLTGSMERLLTIAITYRENNKTVRKSQAQKFSIQLNSEKVVRRVPPGLGNILGMTPKGMR